MKRFALSVCGLLLAWVVVAKEEDLSLGEYAGVYRVADGSFLSLAVFDPGDGEKRLLFTNLESGLMRCLAPAGKDAFAAGPGLLIPTPTEFEIRFQRNDKNGVASLTQDASEKVEARKIETTRQPVEIENAGIKLAGTLATPAGKDKPCPAVVFLHGSGPLTRYSFGPLPDFFLAHGFAVLTYDKRGTGGSSGKTDSATLEDLASDARAAVGFLKSNPAVNGQKIGLVGSSQGGFLAALVASANPNVAFIVDYCGMFVPVWQQELYRTEAEMRGDGLGEAEIKQALDFVKKEFEVGKTGEGWDELAKAGGKEKKWWDYVTKSSSLDELQFYWRTLYSYDPSPPLQKVTCPVLALFGELDRSTPVKQSIENMQNALRAAGNKNFTHLVFPKAGHGLIESERGANNEIPAAKRLVPGLFPALRDWLKRITLL